MTTLDAPDRLLTAVGSALPAVRDGLTVLAVTPLRGRTSDTYAHGVVLVFDAHNDFHPFVVWTAIAREDATIVESGDYCATLGRAVEAFAARGGMLG